LGKYARSHILDDGKVPLRREARLATILRLNEGLQLFGIEQKNVAASEANEVLMAQLGQGAANGLPGYADTMSDFLVGHEKGQGRPFREGLAMGGSPGKKKTNQFGTGRRREGHQFDLLPSLMEFHAEVLGDPQARVRVSAQELQKRDSGDKADLAGGKGLGAEPMGLAGHGIAQTEDLAALGHAHDDFAAPVRTGGQAYLAGTNNVYTPGLLACGVDVTVLVKLSADGPASEAVEFLCPLSALRSFAAFETTNQDLINQSIVVVNSVRISLNLQQVE